jgi:hypothetical protein
VVHWHDSHGLVGAATQPDQGRPIFKFNNTTYGAAYAMPNFLRNILISITGYGWIVLLVGLGILG